MSLFEYDWGRYTIKSTLARKIWKDYMIYMQTQPDAIMSFDTPEFRSLLAECQALDFDALGVPEDERGYTPNDLIMVYGYLTAEPDNYKRFTPLPLKITEDASYSIPTDLRVLVVNPYSKNRELAIEFLEEVVDCMPSLRRTHMLEHSEDTEREAQYIAELERMNDMLENLRAAEEKADEADKLALNERIAEQLERIEEYIYENKQIVSESVINYRNYAKYLIPNLPIPIDDESSVEIYTFFNQFGFGAIDADTLIKNIDGRLRMILMEGV